ncbi:MAG TPA: ABC transporter permease [Bryobacteraceae bacterium]|nr:ABC transporter permease [Bryobacteraceae bacterium]
MILRFVKDSVRRAPRRKALIVAAVAMGSAVATSMLGVMLSIGDKVNRELRQAGSNIVVTPKAASLRGGVGAETATVTGGAAYIREADILKIKSIFWGLNITGISPMLLAHDGPLQVAGVWFSHTYRAPDNSMQTTGISEVNPSWVVRGAWAREEVPDKKLPECVVGEGMALRRNWKIGDDIEIFGDTFRVTGIVSSGDETDDRVLLPLHWVQDLTHHPGVVDRIDVSALTKPEDDFARRDPKTMSAAEFERWNCTNYVVSIAHEIEQAIPGTQARPVRRIADSEGKILDRIGGLMALITLAALLSAGLTVWSLTATTMMERRGEIAIMQAIGASRASVATLLGVEVSLIGLAGGVLGAVTGVELARFVGQSVFHDSIAVSPILPVLIVIAAVVVALAGASQPVRRAVNLEPAIVLREGV